MITDEEFTEDERARYSIWGFMRFDAAAVANLLRSRPLSRAEAGLLGKMLEGQHPLGLRLEVRGQGKGWKPMFEKAWAYRRTVAIGSHIDAQLEKGCTVEEAVIDAAEAFNVSEPTVYRDLSLYRVGKAAGL